MQSLGLAITFVAPLSTVGAWSVQRRRHRTADPRQAATVALVAPAVWLIAASWWGCMVVTTVTGNSI